MAVTPRGATKARATTQRAAVVRTCIGCRQRAAADELLRVVIDPAARSASETSGSAVRVIPDPRRRTPGRGAWLHPTVECVARAQRRKAFARALRSAGFVDVAAVASYVGATVDDHLDRAPIDQEVSEEQ